MFTRKEALLAAIAGVLATSGFAFASELQSPRLSLSPVVTADDEAAAPEGLLQQHLDKLGAGSAFKQAGLAVSGFLEIGYTWNHRHHGARSEPFVWNSLDVDDASIRYRR